MAVYKEPGKNTWRVLYRTTDRKGEEKQSTKRGFKTKREALAWEREMLNKAFDTIPNNTNLILYSVRKWQCRHKHYQ